MATSEGKRLYDALLVTLSFLAICWMLWLSEEYLGIHTRSFGMHPRSLEGIYGLVTMHFLHGDFDHIGNNSLSFLVLNTMLFYFYRGVSWKVFFRIMLIAGAILWLIGRPSNHIGASLIIYGLAAFLFFSGIFRRDEMLLRISLAVAFIYGSIIWWVLPLDPHISWEGHLAGAAVGIALAWLYRGKGPQKKKYQYEIDEELEQERLDSLGDSPANSTADVEWDWDYRPKEDRQGTSNVE
jgi:membrane associated rhomboid family serine protease